MGAERTREVFGGACPPHVSRSVVKSTRPDGSRLRDSLHLARSEQAIDALVRFARLVSDHKAGENVLELLADTLAEHAGADAVAVLKVDGNRLTLAASRHLPEAFHSWSTDADELSSELGRVLLATLRGDDCFQSRTLMLVSAGDLFGAVVLLSRQASDGSEPWRDRLAAGLVNLAATALGTSAHLESLERANKELRRSREALARGEKLRTLGQMAAGVSHDLKNLMNPLFLHLQIAARANGRGSTEQVDETLGHIKKALHRGLDVLERLRLFSRQAPDSMACACDLNALAHEAAALAAPRMVNGNRMSRIHEEFGAPPAVLGQPSEVVSAVVNLIANAIDVLPDGGNIRLRTGEDHGGGWIAVSDDGPGMSPEVQARVFEPFFTTKGTDGTGLGLAMVYATMQRHQGTVHLDSEPGKGATFTLSFPLAKRV